MSRRDVIAIILRVPGLLFTVVGAVLLAALDGATIERVGLGLWWLGALMILDVLLMRDGLPAQLLWGIGVGAGGYAVFYTTAPHTLSEGSGRSVVPILTVVLAVAMLGRAGRRRSSMATLLGELRDKAALAALPERPADPAAEIARIQAIMAAGIAEIRVHHPREAAELSELLGQYRSDHGTDTIRTSSRPTALRNAVAVLVDDMEDIRNRLTPQAPGYGQAVLVVGYARLVADLILGRTR